jgi:uncharacterized protein (TIGR02284 family)
MNMATTVAEKRTSAANSLLRGEMSAVETYEQALPRFDATNGANELQRVLMEHRDSVSRLRALVRDEGGDPAEASGMWGYWAGMVTGLARLTGRGPTLQAMYQGEDHGRNEYESALKDDTVPAEVKEEVRTRLLPRQLEHLRTLQLLVDRQ